MNSNNLIQENFGKRADQYRKSPVHGNPVDLERMVQALKPSKGDTALDVATGGGHTAVYMAPYVKKVIAIDITEEMLKEARTLAFEMGVTNLECLKEDVHQLPFPDDSFEIVTSRLAPHHFSDIQTALQEMVRVLKKGGQLYILDCSAIDDEVTEGIVNKVEWLRDSSHGCSYSKRLWTEMLQQFPLEINRLELYQDKYQLPQWFERMGTPEAKQKEIYKLLHTIPEAYKQDYPFDEKHITTYRIELVVTKL